MSNFEKLLIIINALVMANGAFQLGVAITQRQAVRHGVAEFTPDGRGFVLFHWKEVKP